MAVTLTVTVQTQFCLVTGILELEKCPEKSVQLPYPSHPDQGGESEITLLKKVIKLVRLVV